MPRFTSSWPATRCLLRCWSPNLQIIEHANLVSDGIRATSLARFESGLEDPAAVANWFLEQGMAELRASVENVVRPRADDPLGTAAVEFDALNLIDVAPDGGRPRLEEVPSGYEYDVGYRSLSALFEITGSDWEACRNRADALSLAIELVVQVPASFPCYWGARVGSENDLRTNEEGFAVKMTASDHGSVKIEEAVLALQKRTLSLFRQPVLCIGSR